MKQLSLTLLLSFLINFAFCQARQFPYGGERRRYTIYLPASYQKEKGKSFPLVFNFHGGGMTMTEQMFYSRMNESAEKNGFIVVYPQGIKQDWNVGFEMSYQYGTDDVGYIKALLASLLKEYRIEKRMVYATGLSRGGFFCHRLATEVPESFAAIAAVGAPLPDSVAYFHNRKESVGVMLVQGDRDEIVSYDGKEKAYSSAMGTFEYWKKHNGLQESAAKQTLIDYNKKDSTSVQVMEIKGNRVGVSLVSVRGGGHTWPGSNPFNIGFPLGETSQDINVNDLIWKFLSRHSRKE
ncbi:MAG: Polyhydroxybutyrate depolymerase [Flaviaesturariibacter sp.]|nr:Polyhydroxybutyrate depolymerase [Flaviaesturariibacter sp.]